MDVPQFALCPVHLPENGGQAQERHAGGRNAESVAVV